MVFPAVERIGFDLPGRRPTSPKIENYKVLSTAYAKHFPQEWMMLREF